MQFKRGIRSRWYTRRCSGKQAPQGCHQQNHANINWRTVVPKKFTISLHFMSLSLLESLAPTIRTLHRCYYKKMRHFTVLANYFDASYPRSMKTLNTLLAVRIAASSESSSLDCIRRCTTITFPLRSTTCVVTVKTLVVVSRA